MLVEASLKRIGERVGCHPISCANFRLVPTRRAALLAILVAASSAAQPQKTKNIIFVMTDGLRWQEVFNGADESLTTKENGVSDVPGLKEAYWRDTPAGRRAPLMPFMWSVISKRGQIYGNRKKGSEAYVTNGLHFSYPR